jgi:nicotinamide phosphoribosyltransferase
MHYNPINPILDSDSYKLSHAALYPPEVEHVYSYAESRGGRYEEVMFFGIQPFIRKMIENPIDILDIREAMEFAAQHGEPFNRDGWLDILDRFDGFLPLRIKAVAEGTVMPTRNVMVTVENTDPKHAWLTSYIETALLRQVWYGSTVATRIFHMKRRIKEAFEQTADDMSGLPFALLDFSSRGCSSYQANEIGGAAYLAHFLGSDSVPAVRFVNNYYGAEGGMSGFSVPASEHSVTTSWGRDRSLERKRAYINAVPPGSIISDVLDTWDCFEEAQQWVSLKDDLTAKNLTLVGRPDSGEISDVLPELIRIFAEGFGVTRNSKTYDVINGAKLLWGDGINERSHMLPFDIARKMNISAQSIMTGSGGGLMQADIDRDTCKFAFKASAVKRKGSDEWEGIRKQPITDPGKLSKAGRLALLNLDEGYRTVTALEINGEGDPLDHLHTVYENGEITHTDTIGGIRKRIDAQL